MRLLLALLTLVTTAAMAQGVQRGVVTPDDLLMLYDRTVAIEVPIPAGATTFSISYGPAGNTLGLSTFLSTPGIVRPPTKLRVVVLLPDPSVVNPCAAEEAEAVVIANSINEQGSLGHSRQKVCVPHPEKSSIAGFVPHVLEGATPKLDEWTPILFQSWLVRTDQSRSGPINSSLDLDRNFTVQVGFTDGNSTTFLESPELTLEELVKVPAIAELIAEHGRLDEP